jgi:UDP-N-acetylmuramoylalanine--D-glutamate ligase
MLETIFSAPYIAVAGLGKEGCATISWLRRKSYCGKIIAADQIEKGLPEGADEACFGNNYLDKISESPIIFRTPGIPLEKFLNAGCKMKAITSQSAIILANCKVIGVTGTKGKSTVASLIAHILRKGKIRCHLAGNLGTPFFELPDEAWDELIIAEFSSHQLQDVRHSPNIAVLLGIVPEHLDYYDSFESYVQAKMNILLHQNKDDILVTSPDCIHGQHAIAHAKGKVITFGKSGKEDFAVQGKEVVYDGKTIINTSFLRGSHNAINVAAAIAACSVAGVTVEDAAKYASDFQPLPYRLETVVVTYGIEFIDDPLATTPEALISAIETFEGRIGAIICGGHERDQDYSCAVHAIIKSGAKLVIAFPTTGERIASQLISSAKAAGKLMPKVMTTGSMDDAVAAVFQLCTPGDVCLHSPGAPSFGQFLNYKERSRAFRDAILSYKA